jgi:5-methylcytosine-specific restriction endonuclease McrA
MTTTTEAPRTSKRAPAVDPPGFAEFWAVYPRKVGKQAAREAFAAAVKKPRVTPLRLLRAVKKYASTRQGEDPAHAATWLSEERWLDETPQRRVPPPATPGRTQSEVEEPTVGYRSPTGRRARYPKPIPSRTRRLVYRRAGGRCEYCREERDQLALHHLRRFIEDAAGIPTAEPIDGQELPEDCVALCKDCHFADHRDRAGTFWWDVSEKTRYWARRDARKAERREAARQRWLVTQERSPAGGQAMGQL